MTDSGLLSVLTVSQRLHIPRIDRMLCSATTPFHSSRALELSQLPTRSKKQDAPTLQGYDAPGLVRRAAEAAFRVLRLLVRFVVVGPAAFRVAGSLPRPGVHRLLLLLVPAVHEEAARGDEREAADDSRRDREAESDLLSRVAVSGTGFCGTRTGLSQADFPNSGGKNHQYSTHQRGTRQSDIEMHWHSQDMVFGQSAF